MTREMWNAVDGYFAERLMPADGALEGALEAGTAAGLPSINVAPNQGKLLNLLARLQGARRILEIGALGGYSTIWLARALPDDGILVTLEADPSHAEVAGESIRRAGLADRVDLRVGLALDTLPQVRADGIGPFDLVFVDADKPNIPDYFEWALELSRAGSLIVVDNVVRQGKVADGDSADASVQGVRRFTDMVAAEPRADGLALQTVGVKGYDGLAIVLVTADA